MSPKHESTVSTPFMNPRHKEQSWWDRHEQQKQSWYDGQEHQEQSWCDAQEESETVLVQWSREESETQVKLINWGASFPPHVP